MSERRRWRPAHAGTPSPGNPGYHRALEANYDGKHKAGCLAVAFPTLAAGLLGLALVLLVLYRLAMR